MVVLKSSYESSACKSDEIIVADLHQRTTQIDLVSFAPDVLIEVADIAF